MEKEFIPYEEALALKELGFNEPCILLYRGLDTQPVCQMGYEFKTEKNSDYNDETNYWLTVPTYSQAFRWFREKYKISYSIDWMTRDSKYYSGYYVHFRGINGNKLNRENFIVLNDELPPTGYGVYKTYEEAELACLIKLIEIVKEK